MLSPGHLGNGFCIPRLVECQMLLPLPIPFLFSSAPGPQATMDVHPDAPGGQKKTVENGMGGGSPGAQQGHYPA